MLGCVSTANPAPNTIADGMPMVSLAVQNCLQLLTFVWSGGGTLTDFKSAHWCPMIATQAACLFLGVGLFLIVMSMKVWLCLIGLRWIFLPFSVALYFDIEHFAWEDSWHRFQTLVSWAIVAPTGPFLAMADQTLLGACNRKKRQIPRMLKTIQQGSLIWG